MDKGHVKKGTKNPGEAKSLLGKSETRFNYFKDKEITEKDASIIFENLYGAIREATQSLMSFKGYKPYSHEATISFLKEFYSEKFSEEELNKFDRFRILRSDSEYRAVPVTKEDAESCLEFAKTFIKKVKLMHNTIEETNGENKENLKKESKNKKTKKN